MARSVGPKTNPKTNAKTKATASSPSRRSTGASRPSSAAPAEGPPSREDVEKRAYERYLERGGTDGGDLDDWLGAERELRADRRNRSVD